MATCYNRNLPEYQALSTKFNGDLLKVDGVIESWQKLNNTDEYPTVQQVNQLIKNNKAAYNLRRSEFSDALLSNMSRKKIISKYNDVYYVNNSKPTEWNSSTWVFNQKTLDNNLARLYRYLEINGIPRDAVSVTLTNSKKTYRVEVKENIFTPQDIVEPSRLRTTPRTKHLLKHLGRLFPQLEAVILTPAEAKQYYDTIPEGRKAKLDFSKVNSFYYNGRVILIKGRTSNETLIEEVLHPFIDSVYVDNAELFGGLFEEAKINFPVLWQQIQDSYTDNRGFVEKERELELVTQALSRHFNEEYETRPTNSFKAKIKEFIEWFANIIKNLHEYVTGKPLVIRASTIKPTTKLTDLAKLINTSDVVFEITKVANNKVKFSLTPEMQTVVDYALRQANDTQAEVIKKLMHAAIKVKKSVNMLSAGLANIEGGGPVVVLNEKDHTYMDIITGNEYTSVTKRIKGTMTPEKQAAVDLNLKIGKEFDSILDGILSDKTFDEIDLKLDLLNKEQAREAYITLQTQIKMLKDRVGGGVAIPQVVLFDETTKTAGTADVIIIAPNGQIQIVDLKTSKSEVLNNPRYDFEYELEKDSELIDSKGKLSTRQQHNLQVNMYRRMLENMGYDVSTDEFSTSTIHIKVDIEGKGVDQKFNGTFRYDTWMPHPVSQNKDIVDSLVPATTITKLSVNEALEQTENVSLKGVDQLDPEEAFAESEPQPFDPGIDMIVSALKTYKKGLLDRQKAINTVRSQIYMDKSKEVTLDNIAQSIAAIDIEMGMGRKAISRLYTEFLQEGLKDVRKFKEYVEDPANFGKPEYISYVLNFNRFIETYRGLYQLANSEQLNATQRTLVLNFQIELNSLIGTKNKSNGIIDDAIFNYVKEVVKSRSNRDFTDEQLDELLTFAEDISGVEYQTGDLATSKDTLLALMDKIYKSKKQELLDKLQSSDAAIRSISSRLQKLSPNTDPQEIYKFMVEYDEKGVPTGRYVKRLGKQYYDKAQKLREALLDETGAWKQYINITNIEDASPSDIQYNKDLWKAKQEYANFWRAETESANGKPISGEYHQYTQEFKDARAQHEYFVANGKNGFWVKKGSVSERAYRKFRAKYYEEIDYTKAVVVNGLPTGQIIEGENFAVPKVEFRVAKDTSSKGEVMTSEQYRKIMNPTTELGRVQKEFYEFFVNTYEKEMLQKLPPGQRTAMLGKLPVIRGNFLESLKEKPNIVTSLYANMSRSVKNFFTATGTERTVLTDEEGNMIDAMPIFYVGKVKNEQELANIQAEIDALNEKRKNNEIGISKYKEDMKFLKGKQLKLESAPSPRELNLDLGTALLKFNAMSEHYETMNQIEDTLKAMLKVIESREYQETADTRLYKTGRNKIKNVGIGKYRVGRAGTESNVLRRAKKWMNMVYYDNENVTKTTLDKLADGLISFSSLSYVAFNPFGNFNNYALGRINNSIEALGQRFFSLSSYARAEKEFNKRALPDLIKRTAYSAEELADLATFNAMKLSNKKAYDPYKAGSKYEALVELFRMMDNKSDIRESGRSADRAGKSWFAKATEVGYLLQDAAEYNVQTKIGMAILMDTMIENSETGEQLSLYDAFVFNPDTKEAELKKGFDTIIEKGGKRTEFTDQYRFDLRNKIREVNKQVHGNYAYEDRMVMQSHTIGKLGAQFHKWVAPAIKARFRREYFDENLGWMEGRYISALKLTAFAAEQVAKGEFNIRKWGENFKKEYDKESTRAEAEARAENIIQNTHRTLGEAALLFLVMGTASLLKGLLGDDDDDSDFEKRFENFMIYQADRTYKEMVLFIPIAPDSWTQLYQMMKSPIASTRTLGELGEALSLSVRTPFAYMFSEDGEFYGDSEYVYQRGRRKGQLKVNKAWADALPIIYSIKKWENYIKEQDFFIK